MAVQGPQIGPNGSQTGPNGPQINAWAQLGPGTGLILDQARGSAWTRHGAQPGPPWPAQRATEAQAEPRPWPVPLPPPVPAAELSIPTRPPSHRTQEQNTSLRDPRCDLGTGPLGPLHAGRSDVAAARTLNQRYHRKTPQSHRAQEQKTPLRAPSLRCSSQVPADEIQTQSMNI